MFFLFFLYFVFQYLLVLQVKLQDFMRPVGDFVDPLHSTLALFSEGNIANTEPNHLSITCIYKFQPNHWAFPLEMIYLQPHEYFVTSVSVNV